MTKTVKMSKSDFTSEHTHLVKILKSGSKKEQIKEANEQNQELKKITRARTPKKGYRKV